MKAIVVQPSPALAGSVKVPGSKNSSLALLAAACLADGPVVLQNIPRIADIQVLMRISEEIGIGMERDRFGQLVVDPRGIHSTTIEPAKASSFRTSYYFVGALLAKYGKVTVGYPGGDDFVSRPIDQHYKALQAMGVRFAFHTDRYEASADAGLHGADIYFDTITSGATINAMLAAVRAKGRTRLRNAARDPEVVDTANMLNRMGARIRGAGTDTVYIDGVDALNGCTYAAIPDRLIAGAYLIAAGVTKGSITVEDAIPEHLGSFLSKLEEIGLKVESTPNSVTAHYAGKLKATRVRTAMYPGFATDLQQPLTALLAQAPGRSIVADRIYPKRFAHVDPLRRMGADIAVRSGVALIKGGIPLRGNIVHATDVRAGICLLLAGLAAEGRTTITGVRHIERGYENLVDDFVGLGANVTIGELDNGETGIEEVYLA